MSWVFIILAPLLGGVVYGAERVLRARMQRRQGPPLLQPFYDMFKLMEKRTLVVHALHALLGVGHFVLLWVSVGILFSGGNLLYAIFVHLFALILLVLAGYSVRSVYSHIGANRELLALVAYEPVLIIVAAALFVATGSFEVSEIMAQGATLTTLPLLFIALLMIIPIKVKKSPFDVVEAHQEIVGGVEVEFSGLFYEVIYMAKFLEYLFVYSLVYLFGGSDHVLGTALVLLSFFVINLVDNATARVKSAEMIKIVYAGGLSLGVINLLWVML
jgi:ech hydrogenase subunit B